MTDDRLSGSAKNIGGQVEEGFGRVTGDVRAAAGRLRPGQGDSGWCHWSYPRKGQRSRRFPTHDNRRAPLHGRRDCARYRLLNRSPRSPRRLL